jgi:hypothetical protein
MPLDIHCQTQHYSDVSLPQQLYYQCTNSSNIDVTNPLDPTNIEPWVLTDPCVGNQWRAKAQGARVYAFHVLAYCDDTSGNKSKKWNKHNSILFSAAGLPREEAQKEYNIHFLATSNQAPPLEMMDGFVEQIE